MICLMKTNFFREFSWFWDFQNKKKQKKTPSRGNQKKLGRKKEKHLLKQKNLFQVEKLFFWFYHFFSVFCLLGRVFGFLVLEVKKSKKTHGKSTYHFTYVFLVFQDVLV